MGTSYWGTSPDKLPIEAAAIVLHWWHSEGLCSVLCVMALRHCVSWDDLTHSGFVRRSEKEKAVFKGMLGTKKSYADVEERCVVNCVANPCTAGACHASITLRSLADLASFGQVLANGAGFSSCAHIFFFCGALQCSNK